MFNRKQAVVVVVFAVALSLGTTTARAASRSCEEPSVGDRIIHFLRIHVAPIFGARPTDDFPVPIHP